jgi:hypothetical protein
MGATTAEMGGGGYWYLAFLACMLILVPAYICVLGYYEQRDRCRIREQRRRHTALADAARKKRQVSPSATSRMQ